ncbi:DUF3369 domain-containing protein [Oleisolibacter albus]|uniref:DUF3369 domain-containing protein n=1 Tax=Oleisolibacter albus TaxID=2171757 RepID=UPI000DF36758|nr:DUF3369 domain-containing protein [Oleisolibacter albus]
MSDTDDFLFQDDPPPLDLTPAARPWLVLIVDDDPEVHAMTRLVMKKFTFAGRPVQFLSAYSAEEAMALLRDDPGIALILLDVVMETEDAGLRLVPRIREELNNDAVRIILRTGQPGQAPEDAVIHSYDINDYKAKTELTAQKLGTATAAALRSYEHIRALQRSRRGMERIVDAASVLFTQRSLDGFAGTILHELARVLDLADDGLVCVARGPARTEAQILAGTGRHAGAAGMPLRVAVDGTLTQAVLDALRGRQSVQGDGFLVQVLTMADGRDCAVCLHTAGRTLDALEQRLIDVMAAKITAGFENLYLYDQLRRAHKATVIALAGLADHKDPDGSGDQGLRVSRLVSETALALRADPALSSQIDDGFLDLIAMGAMVYDIGMVAVPDRIRWKLGPLDADERHEMQHHCERGAALLEKASRLVQGSNYLSFGAEVARCHQERWDGSGYPGGLAGTDIPLAARIVAVVDVFDALTHQRSWREPEPVPEALNWIEAQAGTQFDPAVVRAFLKVMADRRFLM